MIKLLRKGKNLEHKYYSTTKADYIIKDLEQNGFEGEYIEVEGVVVYPNYKEADEIVSAWVGGGTMQEVTENSWEYIDDNREWFNIWLSVWTI